MKWMQTILDWTEVWALLIPLTVIIIHRPKGHHIRLIVWYVIAGFILNFTATFALEYYYLMPSWMYIDNRVNNNILYNVHSFIRVLLLGWYIVIIRPYRFPVILKGLLLTYFVFVFINFIFIETPFYLSTRLFAAESIVLLTMCLFYFFRSIQDESQVNWLKHSSFLVCTGVCIYEAITFFIFLFFYPLHDKNSAFANTAFAEATMRLYTMMYLALCILMALALYKSRKEAATRDKQKA
ncbi:MAG: hypothetical protein ACT4OJ_00880 [Bacteroidota bacterium]